MRIAGVDLPRMGMGCWAIGGKQMAGDMVCNYGAEDIEESVVLATLDAARSAGIRVFDSADVYGAGRSETLLGKAFKGRQDVFIVTKLGYLYNEESRQMTGFAKDPGYVQVAVEASLRRLQRDHIDLLLLHVNDLDIETALPILEAMQSMVAKGRVRSIGWSTDYLDRAKAASVLNHFTALEFDQNVLCDRPDMLELCEANELAAFCRLPLAMGVLTGRFRQGQLIGEPGIRTSGADWVRYFKDGMIEPQTNKQLSAIRDLLQVGGRTLAQGALCWLLARNPRNVPIPGASKPSQVIENAKALTFGPLPSEVMLEIDQQLGLLSTEVA
ncbi:aldo/keto reductase [Polycladidibacter stylochi]|uniref:aldo/keto reductase n=1 Tax=Polycladidibacter stylochi TaxID=1807766 RepID=UPI00082C688F|nr:aldo/keto reductase [Pseudovibrio stylochi]